MEYSEENKTESTKEHWKAILIKGKRKKVQLIGCILYFVCSEMYKYILQGLHTDIMILI